MWKMDQERKEVIFIKKKMKWLKIQIKKKQKEDRSEFKLIPRSKDQKWRVMALLKDSMS